MNNFKWIEHAIEELTKQGWQYRYGKKHVMFYPANKKVKPFTVSGTPGDRYGRDNAIKQIRKAGGVL